MEIKINDILINVNLIYKPKNKRIYFRYNGCELIITSYKKFKDKELLKLLEDNKKAIVSLINRFDLNKEKESNILHFLGKEYELEIKEDNIYDVSILNNKIVVKTKCLKEELIKKLIQKFYILNIEEYVSKNFDRIFSLYPDLCKPKLIYKYTKSFFGKCFIKKNVIEISGICMKMEPIYIDCIIHHEICHLKYNGHQKNFYNYFESHFPNARKIQHQLRMLKYKDKY